MKHRRKRRRSLVLLLLAVPVIAIGAFISAASGQPERVARIWTSATVPSSGPASVVEVIDYDFAGEQRRGIYRTVPGLTPSDDIVVTSPDAPDETQLNVRGTDLEIRIGDPRVTVSGMKRYELSYPLSSLTSGGIVSWNAVGTDWNVPIRRAEIHLLAANELEKPVCTVGYAGSTAPCTVTAVAPGHLIAVVEGLGAYEGVTITAFTGSALPAVPAVDPPTDRPEPQGLDIGWVALTATLPFLVGGLIGRRLIRQLGREKIPVGGAADVAFAGGNDIRFERRDIDELKDMATIEFVPPRGLSPAMGGVLLDETVNDSHKAAWLMQASIDGHLSVHQEGRIVTLTRNDGPQTHFIIEEMFGGRRSVSLGSYDKQFARAWSSIDGELDAWQGSGGLWEKGGRLRHGSAAIGGSITAIVLAFVGMAVCSFAAGIGVIALPAVASVGFLLGGAVGVALSGFELHVLTPTGAAMWLRTESFRRFLAESEAEHVEYAAKNNLLREYTAWAVAVGEVDHWNEAMKDSAVTEQLPESDRSFLYAAPLFVSSTRSTSTEPSSSGGSSGRGSFGGGSVGSGGGGGGGGSW